MLKSYIFSIALVSLVSCEKSDDLSEARRNSKVTAANIESMLVVSGQMYVTTIGTQQPSGPYQNWGSSGGGYGWSARFENLRFAAPDDGREYIARRFRNPDGTVFMKISMQPEGAGKPKQGEQAVGLDGG